MQRAVAVVSAGQPLSLVDRPVPTPPSGFIRVRVHYSMILPHDTYTRDMGLFLPKPEAISGLPEHKRYYIPGINVAGVVDAAPSDGAVPFEVGDAVFGLGSFDTDGGGLQEYALLPVDTAAKVAVPAASDATLDEAMRDAVAFPCNAQTAAGALFNSAQGFGLALPFPTSSATAAKAANRDRTLVVLGAGSNVGKLAVQFAALAGVGTIVAVAGKGLGGSADGHLRKLGATAFVDRNAPGEDVAREVKAALGNNVDGAELVIDCANWTYELAVKILDVGRTGARLVTLHRPKTTEELIVAEAKRRGVQAQAKVAFVHVTEDWTAEVNSLGFWQALPEWIGDGRLWLTKYRVVDGFDLAAIEKALDDYRDGSAVLPTTVKVIPTV